jgi:hypothetical protein
MVHLFGAVNYLGAVQEETKNQQECWLELFFKVGTVLAICFVR